MNLDNHTNHYYYIRSKDREVGQSVTNFTVRSHQLPNIRSFMIKKAIIPYTFFPINSTNNTVIIFKNGDTQDRTATIPPGDYTLSELKNELQTQLNTLVGTETYIVTDGSTTNKLTITQSASTFIYRGTSTMNHILGFASTDTANAISHTGVYVYNVSGTDYINVFSSQLTKFDSRIRTSGNDSSNFLFSIPLSNYSPGDVIVEAFHDYIFDYHPHAENKIDIELRDDRDQILGGTNGLNGRDYQIELQFKSYSNNNPNSLNRFN